jgi:hypothetical protein
MAMKIRYILLLIIAIWGMTSCFDDKGNYSYDPKNDIKVTFNSSYFEAILGETVKLSPKLTFAIDSNDVDLSYEWVFLGKKISDQRNLEWVVDTVITSQNIYMNVIDNRTGVTFSGEISAMLSSPYAKEAWVVLAKQDGKSVLSYIREKNEDDGSQYGKFTYEDVPNVYQLVNGEELGSEPVRVLEHFANGASVGNFWILQNGGQGCVDLSGHDFTRDILLNDIFLDGNLPADFKPIDMIDMKWLTCVVDHDGKVYTRKKLTNQLFNSGYFINRPLMFEEKEVDGTGLVRAPFADLGFTVMYDKVHNRFLAIADYNREIAGKVMKLTVDESKYTPTFARLDNLGDMEVLHTGYYEVKEGESGDQGYYSILRDPATGNYYTHDFRVNEMSGSANPSAFPVLQKQIDLSSVIDGTSKNVFNVLRSWVYGEDFGTPYVLISKDNELWLYDREAKLPVEKYYEFPKGQIITAIDSECVGSRRVAIGMKTGEFYVLDLTRKAVNGQIERLVYASPHNFGEIVHIRYKVCYGNSWSF